MQLGRPTFVLVQDIEMGFEKIVKIAHYCGGTILSNEVHLNATFEVINIINYYVTIQFASSRRLNQN